MSPSLVSYSKKAALSKCSDVSKKKKSCSEEDRWKTQAAYDLDMIILHHKADWSTRVCLEEMKFFFFEWRVASFIKGCNYIPAQSSSYTQVGVSWCHTPNLVVLEMPSNSMCYPITYSTNMRNKNHDKVTISIRTFAKDFELWPNFSPLY